MWMWKIISLASWNVGFLLRVYHGGDWNLAAPLFLIAIFSSLVGSTVILTARASYAVEGFLLAGIILVLTGLLELLPPRAVPDVAWAISGAVTLLGMVAIYVLIFRKKQAFILRDIDVSDDRGRR